MDVRDETLGEARRYQWNKEPRLKTAATSWKRQDIQQDLQENHRAGDCEANRWIFCHD
jgi:hypothetical protein